MQKNFACRGTNILNFYQAAAVERALIWPAIKNHWEEPTQEIGAMSAHWTGSSDQNVMKVSGLQPLKGRLANYTNEVVVIRDRNTASKRRCHRELRLGFNNKDVLAAIIAIARRGFRCGSEVTPLLSADEREMAMRHW